MRNGRSDWSTRSNPPAADSRSALIASNDRFVFPFFPGAAAPPSHLCLGVQASSQLYGETSTRTPSGRTSLAQSLRNASGSGSRHSRFAASTASCLPKFWKFSASEKSPPPPRSDGGSAHASPSLNSTRVRSILGFTRASFVTYVSPSASDLYVSLPRSFSTLAAAMNDALKSTPTTSRKCLVNSKDAPPTAHPTSSATPWRTRDVAPDSKGISKRSSLDPPPPTVRRGAGADRQCLAHRSAHLCVNRRA